MVIFLIFATSTDSSKISKILLSMNKDHDKNKTKDRRTDSEELIRCENLRSILIYTQRFFLLLLFSRSFFVSRVLLLLREYAVWIDKVLKLVESHIVKIYWESNIDDRNFPHPKIGINKINTIRSSTKQKISLFYKINCNIIASIDFNMDKNSSTMKFSSVSGMICSNITGAKKIIKLN